MQSAELAARSVAPEGITVRVIDSRTVTLGLGTIALACAELAATRPDDDDALDDVAALAGRLVERTRVFGVLDTMDNLKKGGRIGNAKALLATALSIKPIIEVVDGVVEQDGRQRTRSKALRYLVDKVAEVDGHIDHLAVAHADCSDVDEFVAMLVRTTRATSSSVRSARSSAPTPAAARSASPSTKREHHRLSGSPDPPPVGAAAQLA